MQATRKLLKEACRLVGEEAPRLASGWLERTRVTPARANLHPGNLPGAVTAGESRVGRVWGKQTWVPAPCPLRFQLGTEKTARLPASVSRASGSRSRLRPSSVAIGALPGSHPQGFAPALAPPFPHHVSALSRVSHTPPVMDPRPVIPSGCRPESLFPSLRAEL